MGGDGTEKINVQTGLEIALKANQSKALWFPWKSIYRRTMICGIRFPDNLSLGEETPFVLECLLNAKTVVNTDEKLYCYVQRSGSLAKKRYDYGYFEKLNELYNTKKKVYEKYDCRGYEPDLNQYTMTHTIPLIFSNEIHSGKFFRTQRAIFKKMRNSEMVCEAYKSCSPELIQSKLKYMAYLLKYKQYSALTLLCKF